MPSIGELLYTKCRESEESLKFFTKLSVSNFDLLFSGLGSFLPLLTYHESIRVYEQHAVHRAEHFQLFIFMVILRLGAPLELLAILFDASRRHIQHIITRIALALCLYFDSLPEKIDSVSGLGWPTEAELEELAQPSTMASRKSPGFENVVAAGDCLRIWSSRPAKPSEASQLYYPPEKIYMYNVLILVLLTGQIIFMSKPMPGAHYRDQTIWNESRLRERFIGKPYGIVLDAGFTLNPMGAPPVLGGSAQKAPPKGSLSPEQEDFNNRLKKPRIVAENTIAKIRQFRLFDARFRRHYPEGVEETLFLDRCLKIVANLLNWRLRQKNSSS